MNKNLLVILFGPGCLIKFSFANETIQPDVVLNAKQEIVKNLYSEMDKKEGMNFLRAYDLLGLAARIIKINYDEEFLIKVLAYYPVYFEYDVTHHHLEMFTDSYMAIKKILTRPLTSP